jgi:hypothetical protein
MAVAFSFILNFGINNEQRIGFNAGEVCRQKSANVLKTHIAKASKMYKNQSAKTNAAVQWK